MPNSGIVALLFCTVEAPQHTIHQASKLGKEESQRRKKKERTKKVPKDGRRPGTSVGRMNQNSLVDCASGYKIQPSQATISFRVLYFVHGDRQTPSLPALPDQKKESDQVVQSSSNPTSTAEGRRLQLAVPFADCLIVSSIFPFRCSP
jgi:hypothetical protein